MLRSLFQISVLLCLFLDTTWEVSAFAPAAPSASILLSQRTNKNRCLTSRRHAMVESAALYEPKLRDATYGGAIQSNNDNYKNNNWAQYLVDLHDAKATFDFCGGMLFQLVLTDELREHLVQVAEQQQQASPEKQPVVFEANKFRMHQIPDYQQNALADNCHVFHGREIRQVPHARGGMGMILQLSKSYASDETDSRASSTTDPQGWTAAEIQGYDGWNHDGGRVWREGQRLAAEGCQSFTDQFGSNAFCLHHRFYLHLDARGALWLSAEDGCEGTPFALSSSS